MQKIFFLYFIGISGSGKTTIAMALEKELRKKDNMLLQVIDGDVIREQFGGIFGHTYEERMKCNQVVRVVAQYLVQNGISVMLAQVAPFEEMRKKVREQFSPNYIEIYIKCSLEECERRDVKGYYAKQKKGKIQNLNGVNDVYEVPKNSDIVIDTEQVTVEEAVNKIILYLRERGYDV